MDVQLRPVAGAHPGARCPKTAISWDGNALAVTDTASGQSLRLRPATLYCYSYDQAFLVSSSKKPKTHAVQGLAALDEDGLALLDLPGEWHFPHLTDFVERTGLPLVDARHHDSKRVRTVLAARAPGWRRLHGRPPPVLLRYRKPLSVGVGVAGLAAMVYLASTGMWMAWRGISAVGRMLLDVVEAKWLAVGFSPVLLVVRPVSARIQRWRADRGLILGSATGAHISVTPSDELQITRGKERLPRIRIGEGRADAVSLLLYHYDDLSGLVILNMRDDAVHHLPGPWLPDAANRFARRQGLRLAVHAVSRDEYIALTLNSRDATP
ncbi:hypothetical protein [Nonomuraea aurantiaca]|uniref:hypothetical protein n=1 Tax=Nonomuraea aurantiaca TaxID=2878562 RepID=UPI001CD9A836|nr:hypothetical protein [Nonomuraea aurantiaca]MCA2229619.1 hypothetical protein [Nonomuraea aurantiaca]